MKHNQIVFYQFSRSAVEMGDSADFRDRFSPDALPSGNRLAAMMDSLIPCIAGYDNDVREIYAIPEVRSFYKVLVRQWPFWLFFGNLQTESLMTLALCTVPSLESAAFKGMSKVRVEIDPRDLLAFVSQNLVPMNAMCARAGLSDADIYKRTKALFDYFHLPFSS